MEAQTLFAILVGAALACFSLVMVGYSFFRGNEAREIPPLAPAPEDDAIGVDAIVDSINTLDLEHQLGNVTDDQYREQMASYRMQVAVAVKAELEGGNASPELLLEQEILAARANGAGGWRSCPRCDAPLPVSAEGDEPLAFCPHCNASLVNGESYRTGETENVPSQAAEQ